jgi:hypothetical protein
VHTIGWKKEEPQNITSRGRDRDQERERDGKKGRPKNIERASLTWQRKHDKSTRQRERERKGIVEGLL